MKAMTVLKCCNLHELMETIRVKGILRFQNVLGPGRENVTGKDKVRLQQLHFVSGISLSIFFFFFMFICTWGFLFFIF